MYEKLGGVPAETDWSKHMTDQDDDEPPVKKPRQSKGKGKETVEESTIGTKLDEVVKHLDSVDRRLRILDDLKKGFECCVCKLTCLKPVVAPCCGRIVGCSRCLDRWKTDETCPLCNISRQIIHMFQLKVGSRKSLPSFVQGSFLLILILSQMSLS